MAGGGVYTLLLLVVAASARISTRERPCNWEMPCADPQICVYGVCREEEDYFTNCVNHCPTSRDPVCGSDQLTYKSPCELERENCKLKRHVYIECHHECPCEHHENLSCDKELAIEKMRSFFHETSSQDFAHRLKSSGNVVTTFLDYAEDHCGYANKWAFTLLDLNRDGFLDSEEIRRLFSIFNEMCVEQTLSGCDLNENEMLSLNEWCYCFSPRHQPPCHRALDAVPVVIDKQSTFDLDRQKGAFIDGVYVPMCDEEGFFLPTQKLGEDFWCVNDVGQVILPAERFVKGAENPTDCLKERDQWNALLDDAEFDV